MPRSALLPVVGLLFSVASMWAATDPCSLLTQAQVSEVLGVSVDPGKLVVPTICGWSEATRKPGTSAKKVTLSLKKPQEFAYLKMPIGEGITKTPVSGIGDEAVYGTTPGYATTLSVRKGDKVFVVQVWGFDIKKDDDHIKATEKTLALEVLSKL
jgi:hypothetical protein